MVRIAAVFFVFALSLLAQSPAGGQAAVYCWPMTRAFDQYLAQEIASRGTLAVVSDPERASVVLTERIDERFQSALDEIFPKEEEETEEDSSLAGDATYTRKPNRAMGQPRGTLFLVEIATRRVLWSTFLGDFQRTPERMAKKARTVAEEVSVSH